MANTIALTISMPVFLELAAYLREYGDARDPSEVANTAITSWLAAAKGQIDGEHQPGVRGYQWKNLFLPEGCDIRMAHRGVYAYARVVGDTIVYDGQVMSPAQLANTIGGGVRNAWRDLWIRLPGSKQWKTAAFQRREQLRPTAPATRILQAADPANASAVVAESLKNALILIEKASAHRQGRRDRRTDFHPDD
ncbi:MAG: hypothetical protein V4633_01175 [Pseudomonadota bacterium]